MKLTNYGHACFSVTTGGKTLLFDPFISGNPRAGGVDQRAIKADYILVSHGHGDHVGDLVELARQTGATVVAMKEVADWAAKQGVEKTIGMNYGPLRLPHFGTVWMVPAWHSSSMPDGSYGGNPAGFVVKSSEGAFYYAGDTCLTLEMQLIPRYASIDFALLPIGGHFTMGPADASLAAELVQCRRIVGVHYNTWPPISIDVAEAKKIFEEKGMELLLPGIGETIGL